jgi:hypothetical protein
MKTQIDRTQRKNKKKNQQKSNKNPMEKDLMAMK